MELIMLDMFTNIYFEIACSKIAATKFLFAIESLAYLLESDPDTAMPLPLELVAIFPQDSKVDHFPAAWSEWTGLLAAFEDSEDTDLGIEVRYDEARGRLCIVDTFGSPHIDAIAFLVQRLLPECLPICFQWSYDCSKPCVDAYGGGVMVITQDQILTDTTYDASLRLLSQSEETAKSPDHIAG
jgi:hypothetical protein